MVWWLGHLGCDWEITVQSQRLYYWVQPWTSHSKTSHTLHLSPSSINKSVSEALYKAILYHGQSAGKESIMWSQPKLGSILTGTPCNTFMVLQLRLPYVTYIMGRTLLRFWVAVFRISVNQTVWLAHYTQSVFFISLWRWCDKLRSWCHCMV